MRTGLPSDGATKWLVVGLGNPGPIYDLNRHNVGFHLLDRIVESFSFPEFQLKNKALWTKKQMDQGVVFLLKPMTFMNLSGRAVGPFARFYQIPLDHTWVVHDDLDLIPGKVRIKQGGGTGGHKGLESLDQALGKAYHRLRIGIGHPGHPERVSTYVLQDFSAQDNLWRNPLLDQLTKHFPLLLEKSKANLYVSSVMQAMQAYL